MHKTKFYFAFLVILGLFISSCKKEDTSSIATRTYTMESFEGVELSMAANVTIREGENQKVVITGPSETIDKINRTISNGIWNIGLPSDYTKSYDDVSIDITSNNIKKIILSGSGKITAQNTLNLNSLVLSGSGEINARIESDSLNSLISGSGKINTSGTASKFIHEIPGSGKFEGFGLNTNNAYIKIPGSGTTEITVNSTLDVEISGSGIVNYKGNPKITQNITGSGQLNNAN